MSTLTLQPRHAIIPQPVLGQHTPDRPSQNFAATPFFHHSVHCDLLQTTRTSGVAVILLLEPLLSRGVQVVASNRDDIVAAVGRRVPDGLVLAHQRDGDLRGDATEWTRVRAHVNEVPGAAVGEVCLLEISFSPCSFLHCGSAKFACTFPTYCDIVDY